MPCGPQGNLADAKPRPSRRRRAAVDLTSMGQLAAAVPALGPKGGRSSSGPGMGLSYCSRLAFWFALLTALPIQTGTARVSSSLSTTHHVHHFHNKHGTVPIAINRMPFLTRGGHGKTCTSDQSRLVHRLVTWLLSFEPLFSSIYCKNSGRGEVRRFGSSILVGAALVSF